MTSSSSSLVACRSAAAFLCVACASSAEGPPSPPVQEIAPVDGSPPSNSAPDDNNTPVPTEPAAPQAKPKLPDKPDAVLNEVVFVFNRTATGRLVGSCTGALVSDTIVVTAAHCLDGARATFSVMAPSAPETPHVWASKPRVFGGHYNDVSEPDIGLLTLDQPIALAEYAVLTDVVARVESKGEAVMALARVRTESKAVAPLVLTAPMPVSSSVALGYPYGFATPLFSKAGDSGAGLFLVENGRTTHGLIGIARQPEPDRALDHFTRIDAAFIAWSREGT